MARFVEFHSYEHGLVRVNPDQVCYVRTGVKGDTQLVFGAMTGGLHAMAVAGSPQQVIEALETAPRGAPRPSMRPSPAAKSQSAKGAPRPPRRRGTGPAPTPDAGRPAPSASRPGRAAPEG